MFVCIKIIIILLLLLYLQISVTYKVGNYGLRKRAESRRNDQSGSNFKVAESLVVRDK